MPYNPRVSGALAGDRRSPCDAMGGQDLETSCLKYAPTDKERKTFNRDGYLIVEDALPPDKVDYLTEVTDRCYRQNLLADIVASSMKGYVAAPISLERIPRFSIWSTTNAWSRGSGELSAGIFSCTTRTSSSPNKPKESSTPPARPLAGIKIPLGSISIWKPILGLDFH